MIEWLKSNATWIFEGVGAGVILLVLSRMWHSRSGVSQKQRSGKSSVNIQSAGSIKIGSDEDRGGGQ